MQGALLCAVMPWRPHPSALAMMVQLGHCSSAALALLPERALAWHVLSWLCGELPSHRTISPGVSKAVGVLGSAP